MDRLSYFISNQENQVLGLRAYQLAENPTQTAFKQLFIEDNVIRENYKAVKIAFFSPRFSLVPTPLFDANSASLYLQQTTNVQTTDKVLYDVLENIKIANVYSYEEQQVKNVLEHFPNAKLCHSSTGLLANYITHFDSNNSKNIFLNIYGHHVVITVVEHSQLLFHNVFSFKASPDCLYYVLLVYKQLGLNPQKHTLNVMGDLTVDSEIHKLLYKYIKTIQFVNRPNFYVFGLKVQEGIAQSLFFDLYSLKLCE